MTNSLGGPWERLIVGHHWPSTDSLHTIENAVANRSMAGRALGEYAITIRAVGSSIAAEQRGLTAERIEETFRRGESHSRALSEKNSTIRAAYDAAHQSAGQLRSSLREIASRGKQQIDEIQRSNEPAAVKIDRIMDVVATGQAAANASAAAQSANILAAIQSVLTVNGSLTSARQFAESHGVELTSAFRSSAAGAHRDSIQALLNRQVKSTADPSPGSSGRLPARPSAGAASSGTTMPVTADTVGAQRFLAGTAPNGTSGAGANHIPISGVPSKSAYPSTQLTRASSTTPASGSVTSANASPGTQSTGSPLSEALHATPVTGEHPARHAPTAPGPISQTGTIATPPPVVQPMMAMPPQIPAAPPPAITSPASSRAAPIILHSSGSHNPTGHPSSGSPLSGSLPPYGADIRSPGSASPSPSAAAASAPIHAAHVSTGSGQPAVVRHPVTTTGPATPVVSTVAAKSIAATAVGAAIGTTVRRSSAMGRLQALLDSIARQEPRLHWLVGDTNDGRTILTTDLAGGWIPPGIELPAQVELLRPTPHAHPLDHLHGLAGPLSKAAFTAVYQPGQPIADADPNIAITNSSAPRRTARVDDFGWELTRAARWRDGLPRLAYTLAKAVTTETGCLDAEVNLLREHLDQVANEVLNSYPRASAKSVGNWQLLATVDALIKGEQDCANYHFKWFQALILDDGGRP